MSQRFSSGGALIDVENLDAGYVLKRLLLYVAVTLIVITMSFPLLWMALSSLKHGSELYQTNLIPHQATLENYRYVFTSTDYPLYFKNSLIIAISTMLITVVASTMGAYGITRYRFPGRDYLANSVLVMYMLPPITLIIPLFIIFSFFNLINTMSAVVLGHIIYSLPFSLWFLRGFFSSIPTSYEEAAICEGASRFQAVVRVVLPLALPGIVTVALFSFTVSWNDYLFALTFIQSSNIQTLTLATTAYADAQGVQWGILTAISALLGLPPLMTIIFLKKHLLQGFGVAT